MSDAQAVAGQPPRRSRQWAMSWIDVGVIVVVAPVVLAALRLLFFSGGDPVLLRVLTATLDVPTVVLGTVLPSMPLVIWGIVQPFNQDPGSVERALGGGKRGRWIRRCLLVAATVAFLALGPWPTAGWWVGSALAGVALVAILWWVVSVVANRRAGRKWRVALRPPVRGEYQTTGFSKWLTFAISVPLAVALVFPSGFWLPQEVITLKGDPSERVSGYLLDQSDGWSTILQSDREVRILRANLIVERSVCGQSEYESLLTMWLGPGDEATTECDLGAG